MGVGKMDLMNRSIGRLLSCMPKVRESFYTSGFEVPSHYLAAIEATRQRGEDERDYEHYLDEVLREYAALPYPWQPSVRHLLAPEDRSAYLDLLASRSEGNSISLDPNFNLFAQGRLDGDVRRDQMNRFRAQKQKELQQHAAELGETAGDTLRSLVDGVLWIAERHGYYLKRPFKARDESFELESCADRPVGTSLRVVDLPALKKHGYVIVQYFFRQFPDKPFGLDTFVPGGHLYSEWNKSAQAVLFSFFAQCRFLASLNAEVDRLEG
jgi:hypothetical protein